MTFPARTGAARVFALSLAVASLSPLAGAESACACATAAPPGRSVAVAQESAVVVWDPKTKTEHFIRRSVFSTQAPHFGFLVPSPSRPALHEESDGVLDRLEQIILPDLRTEATWDGVDATPFMLLVFARGSRSASGPADAPSVRVLEQTRVGPFEAAVLQADDAGALSAWLREHGYDERASLRDWLEPYVAQKWFVTAFRIADPDHDAGDAGGPGAEAAAERAPEVTPPRALGGGTVRMTFTTERPFFPYREPRDQREGATTTMAPSRALRVFFVGPSRAEATIGDGATPFPGKVSWAGPLDLATAALPVTAPPGAWLTAFEDDASPRPGVDELWLAPSKEVGLVRPAPVTVRRPRPVSLPIDVALVLAGFGLVSLRSAARRRRLAAARKAARR